jgi:hypothetical protein
MPEDVCATVVCNELNFTGHGHVAPDGDQIGFGAKGWEVRESAVFSNDGSGSAKTPNAQAKTPIAEVEKDLTEGLGDVHHRS